jgi:hypothetical protein
MLECIEQSILHCTGPTVLYEPAQANLSAAEELFLDGLDRANYPHRVRGTITELEKFLKDLLGRAGVPDTRASSLNLICDLGDFAWARHFEAQGLSVDYPRFLLEPLSNMDKLRRWKQMVRSSSGLLFYQGNTGETLLERVERIADEEKSDAIRRWYLDHPDLASKRGRRPDDATYPEGLDQFLEDVRHRAAAGGS